MAGACGNMERTESAVVWCGNLKQRYNLKTLGGNDRIILKLNFKKKGEKR